MKYLYILLMFFACYLSSAQCMPFFNNPSFEDSVTQINRTPPQWNACLAFSNLLASPDILPLCQWDVCLPPTNGNTYLGLLDAPWSNVNERIWQRLNRSFIAGEVYNFTIDLYDALVPANYGMSGIWSGAIELQVLAGFDSCTNDTVLWRSGSLPYNAWKRDTITFTPKYDYTYVSLKPHSLNQPLYGKDAPYVCLDNIQEIKRLLDTISKTDKACITDTTAHAIAYVSGINPPYRYSWSNGNRDSIINNLNSGKYYVTITDNDSCSIIDSVQINETELSVVVSPRDSTIDFGEPINLNVSANFNVTSIRWQPSTFLNCDTCLSVIADPSSSITYYAVATDENGCITIDSAKIVIDDRYVIYIPNAFTPNGDGNNDYFMVYGDKVIWKYFYIAIFDRTGELIFSSDNKDFKWDGTYKGVKLNPAVFVYYTTLVFENSDAERFKGSITLIR